VGLSAEAVFTACRRSQPRSHQCAALGHVRRRDLGELVPNRTWRPMLSVTGADGLPAPANAGNVLRPRTQLVLSLRLPPTA